VGFFLIRFTGQGFVAMAGRNMVAKWWKYHRGKVLPFSGIGVSVCFSLSPIVFYDLIQSTDWRTAWQILGLATGVGFALYGWLVFRDNPQDCGLSVDAGIRPGESQKDDPEFSVVKDLTRGEAVRTFSFWVFTGIFALQALQITAYVFHVLDLGKQLGLTSDIILGLFFPSALIGGGISVFVGWFSDRFRLKYFAALMASGIGLSSFSLLTRIDGLLIPMLVAGLSITSGCFGPISGAFAARYFGIKHIGAISGVFMSTMIVGSSVGPLLFSLVRDYTGSYIPAFGGTFTLSICFVVASFWANNPQRKIKAEKEKAVD
jgi:MFS family permease